MADPFILLQVRKGLEVDLPTLSVGEFGWCEDSKKLFIGSATGNEYLCKYSPATPANWSGSAPNNIKDALDRIAAVVAVLNGGPI